MESLRGKNQSESFQREAVVLNVGLYCTELTLYFSKVKLYELKYMNLNWFGVVFMTQLNWEAETHERESECRTNLAVASRGSYTFNY